MLLEDRAIERVRVAKEKAKQLGYDLRVETTPGVAAYQASYVSESALAGAKPNAVAASTSDVEVAEAILATLRQKAQDDPDAATEAT
jgi:hypothetical protein